MDLITSKRPIYSIIAVIFVGVFSVFYRLFSSGHDDNETIDQDIIIKTNDIISSGSDLPPGCIQTIDLLNCMISSPNLSGDKEGINQYYQKLISERNNITDLKSLKIECDKQYSYITSLQEPQYQSTVQSCQHK